MSVQVISKILDGSPHTHGVRLVLIALANYSSPNACAYPSIPTIARCAGLCERNVQKVIKFLVKKGHLKIYEGKGPNGVRLYEILPGSWGEDGGVNSCASESVGVNSHAEKVDVNSPGGVNSCAIPYIEPSVQPSVQPSLIQESDSKTPASNQKSKTKITKYKPEDTEVQKIYAEYPRKEDRKMGLKAISNVLNGGVNPEFLLDRTMEYSRIRGTEDRQFIPLPATWFNKERFNDDPNTWKRIGACSKPLSPAQEMFRIKGIKDRISELQYKCDVTILEKRGPLIAQIEALEAQLPKE